MIFKVAFILRSSPCTVANTAPANYNSFGAIQNNNQFLLISRKRFLFILFFFTLSRHEVCEVPDELSHNEVLPLLIKHSVVVLQDGFLVLLSKHRRGILKEKEEQKKGEVI